MLALRTGWTPDVIAELPAAFRAACHWALYARAAVGPNGLPQIDIPKGAPLSVRQEALRHRAQVLPLREALYPGDE